MEKEVLFYQSGSHSLRWRRDFPGLSEEERLMLRSERYVGRLGLVDFEDHFKKNLSSGRIPTCNKKGRRHSVIWFILINSMGNIIYIFYFSVDFLDQN